jgi:hypothetical protein
MWYAQEISLERNGKNLRRVELHHIIYSIIFIETRRTSLMKHKFMFRYPVI